MLGLIGFPLEHSFSKTFFNTHLLKDFPREFYQNFPLENLFNLPSIIENTPNLRGLNVTIPHKQNIIPLLDSLDPYAQKIGAVNTILIQRDTQNSSFHLRGFNTDAPAFKKTLLSHPRFTNLPKMALILGNGGAAAAVETVLKELKIIPHIIARKPNSKTYKTFSELAPQDILTHKLIINCTPLGTKNPTTANISPLPKKLENFLSHQHFLYDLVYNPPLTPFLLQAKLHNAAFQNGLAMLHLQAQMALKIWLC